MSVSLCLCLVSVSVRVCCYVVASVWDTASLTTGAPAAFRLQQMGWRDIDEYCVTYGRPEVWPDTGFFSMLISKESGFFTYWRRDRECEDKYVHRVKVFTYEDGSGPSPVAELATYRAPVP